MTSDSEEWLSFERLEKFADFSKDLVDVFDSEPKNIWSWELGRLQDEGDTILGFTNFDLFHLDPWKTDIERFGELRKPHDSNICDDEGSQVTLFGWKVPDAVILGNEILSR